LSLHALALHLAVKILLQIFLYEDLSTLALHKQYVTVLGMFFVQLRIALILMKNEHQLDLPRRLQIEFSQVIQAKTDSEGGEVSPDAMWHEFEDEYLPAKENQWGRFKLTGLSQSSHMDEDVNLSVELIDKGKSHNLSGSGNGPIAAFVAIVNAYEPALQLRVLDYYEHALSAGGDAKSGGIP
jgi:2-isopropylmalate synthase